MKTGISTLLFSCNTADAGQAHTFGLQKKYVRIADAEQGSSGREIFFGANSSSSVNFKQNIVLGLSTTLDRSEVGVIQAFCIACTGELRGNNQR
jgi:hypothetical protein